MRKMIFGELLKGFLHISSSILSNFDPTTQKVLTSLFIASPIILVVAAIVAERVRKQRAS